MNLKEPQTPAEISLTRTRNSRRTTQAHGVSRAQLRYGSAVASEGGAKAPQGETTQPQGGRTQPRGGRTQPQGERTQLRGPTSSLLVVVFNSRHPAAVIVRVGRLFCGLRCRLRLVVLAGTPAGGVCLLLPSLRNRRLRAEHGVEWFIDGVAHVLLTRFLVVVKPI